MRCHSEREFGIGQSGYTGGSDLTAIVHARPDRGGFAIALPSFAGCQPGAVKLRCASKWTLLAETHAADCGAGNVGSIFAAEQHCASGSGSKRQDRVLPSMQRERWRAFDRLVQRADNRHGDLARIILRAQRWRGDWAALHGERDNNALDGGSRVNRPAMDAKTKGPRCPDLLRRAPRNKTP